MPTIHMVITWMISHSLFAIHGKLKLPLKMTSQHDDKSLKQLGYNIPTKYILCMLISMTF